MNRRTNCISLNFVFRVSSLISLSHRSFRRKCGIPDDDDRPLNIAISDVRRPCGPEEAATSRAEPARQGIEHSSSIVLLSQLYFEFR